MKKVSFQYLSVLSVSHSYFFSNFRYIDKRRANELIKSMRRMPNWHMTNHYIGNNKMMTMNNYKHHNAQFANGWRAVPLPKIGKVPIKIHSSSVAIPVVIPIVTTTTTTTTTEKPIPSPTTTSATIEISSIDFSPIPVMHIINQQPKPMMIENNDDDDRNNQTYASKCHYYMDIFIDYSSCVFLPQ